MRAKLLVRHRVVLADTVFAELVLWELPQSVLGSSHNYKYRLALVADGQCVLRFDNERGKGDHRHIEKQEVTYMFVDIDTLLSDFRDEVARWIDAHDYS